MEVKKDGLRQTQDGLWKLTLTVHPDDFPQSMAMAPMGTRYMVGYAEIGDDDQPVTEPTKARPKEEDPGKRAVTRAVLLCKEKSFQEWLGPNMSARDDAADWAAKYVRTHCGIQSRSELSTNEEARKRFEVIEMEFKYRDQLERTR